MTSLDRSLLFGAGLPLVLAIVFVADRKGAFRRDAFSSPFEKARRAPAPRPRPRRDDAPARRRPGGAPPDVSTLRFSQVFAVQALLAGFLLGWWLLSGRPPLRAFLGLDSERPLAEAGAGVALGLIGWTLTIVVGVAAALLFRAFDYDPHRTVPPARGLARLPPAPSRGASSSSWR